MPQAFRIHTLCILMYLRGRSAIRIFRHKYYDRFLTLLKPNKFIFRDVSIIQIVEKLTMMRSQMKNNRNSLIIICINIF